MTGGPPDIPSLSDVVAALAAAEAAEADAVAVSKAVNLRDPEAGLDAEQRRGELGKQQSMWDAVAEAANKAWDLAGRLAAAGRAHALPDDVASTAQKLESRTHALRLRVYKAAVWVYGSAVWSERGVALERLREYLQRELREGRDPELAEARLAEVIAEQRRRIVVREVTLGATLEQAEHVAALTDI